MRVRSTARGDRVREAPAEHWPVSPAIAERAFERGDLRVVSERYAGRGITGARVVTLDWQAADGTVRLRAKWKPSPRRLDAFNNSPRREIAAYEIQKLFLEPADYVVPTSRLRCLEAEDFANPNRHRATTFVGTRCRVGLLSLWLENVALPERLLDPGRFLRDAVYARRLADFNLAMYLINHKDGRRGNFLVANDDADRRIFSVDNGVAFSGLFYNWFVPNWKKLRVPALRRVSVDRLRRLTRRDVERLGVVAQLELRAHGVVESVPPTGNLGPDMGVRVQGRIAQIGLDSGEIENLWKRIEHLIEDVDRGRVSVF
jgi:hypothetical protein